MSHRAIKSALALLALAMFSAGCGGDSESHYVEDANAICAKVVDQLPDPSSIQPGSATADQQFEQLANARGKAISELRELEPPPSGAATAEKMLRQLSKSQRLLEEAGRGFGESEMAVATLIAAAREDDEAHEAARSLGLEECARL